MKLGKKLIPTEFKGVPPALLRAMDAPMSDVVYCHVCDGLRLKKHTCVEWFPDATEWARKSGFSG